MLKRSGMPISSSSASPSGACGPVAEEDFGPTSSGRDRSPTSRFGQGRGGARDGALYSKGGIQWPAHPSPAPNIPAPIRLRELFINRWCILTPPEGTDPAAVEKLRAFWTGLGAKVEVMTRTITTSCSRSPPICRI